MAEPIKLTLGDGSIIVGQTLEEAEKKLAALKKQAPSLDTQIIDAARLRRLPRFDRDGNRK